jgi:hypothetical protein
VQGRDDVAVGVEQVDVEDVCVDGDVNREIGQLPLPRVRR